MYDKIASLLVIRTATKIRMPNRSIGYRYSYEETSEEVKRQFARELLQNYRKEATSRANLTNYWYEEFRGYLGGKLRTHINLKIIFAKLPNLPEGKEYAFVRGTWFFVPFPEKGSILWNEMSPNIRALYHQK